MSKILKETEDFVVIQKGNIYILRYFDEVIGHPKYNRNKPVILSRVTKNRDFINQIMEAV